jgi:hypothetical protein
VIAAQRDQAIPQLVRQAHDVADHAGRVGAAVDVIAEKHQLQRAAVGVLPARFDQRLQSVERAVDIADRVGERHSLPFLKFSEPSQ